MCTYLFFPFFSSSQFLMSPVYPKYYVGGRRCKWILRADPGQRIQLRFLDISLREEVSQSSHPQCTDTIRVTERGRNLLSMCGESKQDIVLLSEANKLEVSLHLSYEFLHKSLCEKAIKYTKGHSFPKKCSQ